jgi:hypothetical protein
VTSAIGWLIAMFVAGGKTATLVATGITAMLEVVGYDGTPEDHPPVAGTVVGTAAGMGLNVDAAGTTEGLVVGASA